MKNIKLNDYNKIQKRIIDIKISVLEKFFGTELKGFSYEIAMELVQLPDFMSFILKHCSGLSLADAIRLYYSFVSKKNKKQNQLTNISSGRDTTILKISLILLIILLIKSECNEVSANIKQAPKL